MSQLHAVVDVPATSEGPMFARALLRTLLTAWNVPSMVDDAELVVSELFTNALQHAAPEHSLELDLARRTSGVRLGLTDGSAIAPLVQELSTDTPTGRGMRIVETLAAQWGTEHHGGGKRVWVDLDAP